MKRIQPVGIRTGDSQNIGDRACDVRLLAQNFRPYHTQCYIRADFFPITLRPLYYHWYQISTRRGRFKLQNKVSFTKCLAFVLGIPYRVKHFGKSVYRILRVVLLTDFSATAKHKVAIVFRKWIASSLDTVHDICGIDVKAEKEFMTIRTAESSKIPVNVKVRHE